MRFEILFRSSVRRAGALALCAVWLLSLSGCETICHECDVTDTKDGEFRAEEIVQAPKPAPREEKEEPVLELRTVYFDYNRAEIRRDQRSVLRANIAAIRAASWKRVVIEGHCDERGSEEYNLALGERRARAVRQYLVDNGVPAERIDTVSFGETRPAVRGHNERAWSQNRRASFSVVR